MKSIMVAVLVGLSATAATTQFDSQFQAAVANTNLPARIAMLREIPCADETDATTVADAMVQTYLRLHDYTKALEVCASFPYRNDAMASAEVSVRYSSGDLTVVDKMRPFLTSANQTAKSRANRFLAHACEQSKDWAGAEKYWKAAFDMAGTDFASLASAVKCAKQQGNLSTYNAIITEALTKKRLMSTSAAHCALFRALTLSRAEMSAFCDKLLPNVEPVPANSEFIYLVQNTAAMLGK